MSSTTPERQPGTPPPPPDTKPRPLPPRNYRADADTSAQRKRPRLDSGTHAHQAMPIDSSGPEGTPRTPTRQPSSPVPTVAGTPSRVTINVRPPAPVTSPVYDLAQETESVHLRSQPREEAVEDPTAATGPSSSPVPDRGTPDETSSPEIEIAGPEDVGGATEPVWIQPLGLDDADENLIDLLMNDFPFLGADQTLEHTLENIRVHVISRDDAKCADIIARLTNWLERYLRETERHANRWFEQFSEAREFWDAIPVFMEAILLKAAVPGTKLELPGSHGATATESIIHPGPQLLQAYAYLTARMLLVDHRTLQETANDSTVRPDLMSSPYVRTLSLCIRCMRTPAEAKLLVMLYECGFDIDDVAHTMLRAFTDLIGPGLNFLTHHVLYIMNRAILEDDALVSILDFARHLVAHWAHLVKRNESQPAGAIAEPTLTCFFDQIHARLLELVRQQSSSLRLENMKLLVHHLSRLVRTSVVSLSLTFPDHTPDDYDLSSMSFESPHRAYLINASWKMALFEACITKGHMDARIFAVDGMQDLLHDAWSAYIARRPLDSPSEPVIEFLADFIHNHGLVHHLVTVGSHRQLVVRSAKIITFLLVTDHYTDTVTDTIWKALQESQDPRGADSVAELAYGLLHNMQYAQLFYLFGKFQQLPTAAFDARQRSLCIKVVLQLHSPHLIGGATAESNMELASLFVRILQELYTERDLPLDQRKEIREFALHELSQVHLCATPALDRMAIFSNCFHQVANATPLAYGSASVLMVLFEDRPLGAVQEDVLHLEAEFGMTQKVIEGISQFTKAKEQIGLETVEFHDLLGDHLALLSRIVVYLPASITPTLTEQLWTDLVGSQAFDDKCRAKAWTTLGVAISFCSAEHRDLIERLAHVHFPVLDPSSYTPETLGFADRVANYDFQFREREADTNVTNGVSVFCHNEIHWSIALKTPNPAIAMPAIDSIVHRQLEGCGIVVKGSDDDNLRGHAKFVERAVEHVIRAAKEFKSKRDGINVSENEDMSSVTSQDDPAPTVRFHNSLAILSKFVEQIRHKSPISPQSESVKSGGASMLPGAKVTIRYQAHAAGRAFAQNEFEVGDLATFKNLYDVLSARTGFTKLKVIAGGATIDLPGSSEMTIRDIPSLHRGLVLVQKLPGDSTPRVLQLNDRLSPLEEEVMRHFYDLYELLDLDPRLGREAFDFLSSFPPHPDILVSVCDYNKSAVDMFPSSSSFKGLYGIYALQTSLNAYLQQGVSAVDILAHGIRNLSVAIQTFDASTYALTQPGSVPFVTAFVNALLAFLKEPVPVAVSVGYFEQPNALIDRLSTLVNHALMLEPHIANVRLIDLCFRVILEAALHHPELRSYIASRSEITTMMKILILESPFVIIRDAIGNSLDSLFAALDSTAADASADYYQFFWDLFQQWIPDAVQRSDQARQFFTVTNRTFKSLSDKTRAALPLSTYREQWSQCLCAHNHSEFVGQFSTDWVVWGLANLLHWSMVLFKSGPSLQLDDNTIDMLFWRLLFSRNRDRDCLSVEAAESPVLAAGTRAPVYHLLLTSSSDASRLLKVIRLCQEVITNFDRSNAWTWGYALLSSSADDYNENRNFEGKTAIRAPAGYAGLRNLSNTCYLNSLCTQLFMNVEFRSFLLSIGTNAWSPQTLVYEMTRLFSYLQHTWLHAVDPEPIADVIINYEGTTIDVSIQMDVDEFYNLLFDRLESQIIDPSKKEKFRKFYGGQLVQQIKSKDCEHISERLEPFSAIQCDIQGKSNLFNSLSAYVEGETMDGDNKYSCSSCGSYVNAVKRACLKDVPDDLIFHLKRFDYDLATGTRSKINEYFEFPFEIDMAPYNIDYLKDTSTPSTPDVFVLVGVLVHTGQAEAGHYYSYIRDLSARGDVWFEFNDSEVNSFDPANMRSACFGGVHDEAVYGNEPWLKPWSAYMLFYRRKSVFVDIRRNSESRSVAASRVSGEVAERIQAENDRFIQKFCMFDDEHGNFAMSLMEKHLNFRERSACSDQHDQEEEIIAFALEHLDLIFSRQKDSKYALPMLAALKRMAESCLECTKVLLNRFIEQQPAALQSLLVKCPAESVRHATADLLLASLTSLRMNDPQAYGISGSTILEGDAGSFLRRFLSILSRMQELLYESPKGWDEFYGLLINIAYSGPFEASALRQMGFLTHCLQLLGVLTCKPLQRTLPRLSPFWKAFERRHISLLKLIHLAEYLLREAESASDATSNDDESPSDRENHGLDPLWEALLLRRIARETRAPLAVLLAVFRYTKDDTALAERFTGTLLNSSVGESHETEICHTIASGLSIDHAADIDPFLHGGLAFCEHSANRSLIRELVVLVAQEIPSLKNSGGLQFLGFFQRVRRAHNIHLLQTDPDFFKKLVLEPIGKYGASLLYYPKADVRTMALDFFTDIFADRTLTEDDDYARQINVAAAVLSESTAAIPLSWQEHAKIDARRLEEPRDLLRFVQAEFFQKENADEEDGDQAYLRERVENALNTIEALATSSPDEDLLSTATGDSESGLSDFSTPAAA